MCIIAIYYNNIVCDLYSFLCLHMVSLEINSYVLLNSQKRKSNIITSNIQIKSYLETLEPLGYEEASI